MCAFTVVTDDHLIKPVTHELIEAVFDATNATPNVQSGRFRKRPIYLKASDINEKLGTMPEGREKMLIRFLWMTGVRVTEALGVRKRDLDLQGYMVTVRWLKSRRYEFRQVPLHPGLRDMLGVYAAHLHVDDLLFPFSRFQAFRVVKQRMGVSPHKLRHSFAVNCHVQGMPLDVLRAALGHATVRVTSVYSEMIPMDVGRELQKVRF